MNDKIISQAVIKRLPRYYRYLGELLEKGVDRISSQDLSDIMQITASQIRQDLNNFGGFGQQGYGYNVSYLRDEIAKILGIDKTNSVVVIGAGKIGQAIVNYVDFEKSGFKFISIFDNNPNIIGQVVSGIEVRSTVYLENFIKENKVDIVALTLPKEYAPDLAKQLVKWGATAFWNFAPIDLGLPKNVIVENVHLAESLMRLSYKVNVSDKEG